MCMRSDRGSKINPNLANRHLSLGLLKQALPMSLLSQLDEVYLCGNTGDPIIAPDCLETVEFLRQSNPDLQIHLHTNGSARATEWWKKLATVMGDRGTVFFGIDGLADTNHRYRRAPVTQR